MKKSLKKGGGRKRQDLSITRRGYIVGGERQRERSERITDVEIG